MAYDVSILFMECIRLREWWNFTQCREYEPLGLTYENRWNMNEYEASLPYKKFNGL